MSMCRELLGGIPRYINRSGERFVFPLMLSLLVNVLFLSLLNIVLGWRW